MLSRLALLIIHIAACAHAFNFYMTNVGDSGFYLSTSQRNLMRRGTFLDLAKSRNARPSGLVPSDELDSRKVLEALMIKTDFRWAEIKDVVGKDFSVPSEPIFNVDYSKRDERYIAQQIVEYRVLPIMNKAQVYSFHCMKRVMDFRQSHLGLSPLTQIDKECCVWEGSVADSNIRSRLSVNEVLPWSTVGGGRIDVSLMASALVKKPFPKGVIPKNVLMGMFEVQKQLMSTESYEKAVSQTICYMCSALAFSRWGMLRNPAPLVALLLTPTCIYRLTVTKSLKEAVGLNLAIEKTSDLLMMEWVLHDYIQGFVKEQTKLVAANVISPDSVNPLDWAPLNFDGSKWTPISTLYNLGFLFRTTSDELKIMCARFGLMSSKISQLPAGMQLVVKHVNILLKADYDNGISSIDKILTVQELLAEIAGNKGTTPPMLAAPSGLDFLHPYIDILGTVIRPLIVMKDLGLPLSDLFKTPNFRQRWAQSPVLRRNFLNQICMSALNLITRAKLCHNDIRPPNICVVGDDFCLIDFDISRTDVSRAVISAFVPNLSYTDIVNVQAAQMMCFSVAQIVLTVFMLISPTVFSVDEVTEAVSVWKAERDTKGKVDKEFEDWVQSKGGSLLEFVAAVRGSAPWPSSVGTDCKGYCKAVLEFVLD